MIGIDFGTTNSAIAHVLAGEVTSPIIDPITNEVILPSVIFYETPDRVIVGKEAKACYFEMAGSYNRQVFRSIKRLLKNDRTYKVFDRNIHDTEIAAHIFRALKNRAVQVLKKEINSAVVTIPVYFDTDHRKAIRNAAQMAGIHIEGFLHEPVAVVYPYCHEIDYTQFILVLDWGGGTLDISILKVDKGMISELEVGGDEKLGGDDIDQNIADSVFKKFLVDKNLPDFDLSGDPTCYQRLITRSETAKIQLSDLGINQTPIDIPYFYNNNDLMHVIDRAEFEKNNEDIFKHVMDCVTETLGKIKKTPKDIDQVVMAGGSSRIPYLIKKMEETFGTYKIRTMPNADTCVAEGAALMAYKSFNPVVAVPIGVELDNGYIHTFLEKGDSIKKPFKQQIQLVVTDPRPGTANIVIFESESGDLVQ